MLVELMLAAFMEKTPAKIIKISAFLLRKRKRVKSQPFNLALTAMKWSTGNITDEMAVALPQI